MNEIQLTKMFNKPIDIQELLDENEKHKKEMGEAKEIYWLFFIF